MIIQMQPKADAKTNRLPFRLPVVVYRHNQEYTTAEDAGVEPIRMTVIGSEKTKMVQVDAVEVRGKELPPLRRRDNSPGLIDEVMAQVREFFDGKTIQYISPDRFMPVEPEAFDPYNKYVPGTYRTYPRVFENLYRLHTNGKDVQ